MGKGNDSPPPAPDPVKTAQAQTQSNQQTALYQAGLNMVNQVTPYGTLTYNMVKPGSGDTPPQYSATVALSPQGQKAFDLQQQVSTALQNLALKGTAQASSALGKTFPTTALPKVPSSLDLSSLGALPTLNEADRQKAEDAIYAQNTSYLDPQYAQAQKQLQTQLTNAGISVGSDAYNSAMTNFANSKQQAYSNARNSAISGAADYANQILSGQLASYGTGLSTAQAQANQALTANQLEFGQQAYERELPINEVTALEAGGQVGMPSFVSTPQTGVANTNVAGITQQSYEDQLNAWQTQQAQQQSTFGNIFGGLASLGSAWLMAPVASDRRVKTDIKRVGKTDSGIPVYVFRYKSGGPVQMGVMAQDLEKRSKVAKAVREIGGVKHVDYSQIA